MLPFLKIVWKTQVFFFPLKAFKDEGKTKVWFVVKPDAKDVFYLSFDYGEDCGISVTLPVEFH